MLRAPEDALVVRVGAHVDARRRADAPHVGAGYLGGNVPNVGAIVEEHPDLRAVWNDIRIDGRVRPTVVYAPVEVVPVT